MTTGQSLRPDRTYLTERARCWPQRPLSELCSGGEYVLGFSTTPARAEETGRCSPGFFPREYSPRRLGYGLSSTTPALRRDPVEAKAIEQFQTLATFASVEITNLGTSVQTPRANQTDRAGLPPCVGRSRRRPLSAATRAFPALYPDNSRRERQGELRRHLEDRQP